jgi:ATP-dependent DNA helicase RecG
VKEAYVRHGDRSVKATDYELNNLTLKGKKKTYDSLASTYGYDGVSFTLLKATYKQENEYEMVIPRDLVSAKLITPESQVPMRAYCYVTRDYCLNLRLFVYGGKVM